MQISKETYDLFYAMSYMVNSKGCLETILYSGRAKYDSKKFINKLLNRLQVNINDIRTLLPPSDTKIIDEQMLDAEVCLQVENIRAMIADLPKAKRDEIERYIEVQHRVYKQN